MNPVIAVTGIAGLPAGLRSAGYTLLTEQTTPEAVAAAVRNANPEQPVIVIARHDTDPRLVAWLNHQVGRGRYVAIVGGDGDLGVEGARWVELPTTIDGLMGVFGAPPAGGPAGGAVVGEDFTVGRVAPPVEAAEPVGELDPFDDFGPAPAQPAPSAPDAPPAPVEPVPSVPSVAESVGELDPFDDFGPAPAEPAPSAAAAPPASVQPSRSGVESVGELDPFDDFGPGPVQPGSLVRPELFDDFGPSVQSASQSAPPAAPPTVPHPAPSTPPTPPVASQSAAPSGGSDLFDDFGPQRGGEPARPVVPVAGAGGDEDLEGLVAPPTGGSRVVRTHGLAPVIIVFAGKGGVGKTSLALTMAQRAVEVGKLKKVILIDGNRGQGDIRKYVRLTTANLPTAYDAALSGVPQRAILGPKTLQEHRDARLAPLGFGLVMAPRDGQTDPSVVSAAVYGRIVEAAREFAELVIVDTQILEDTDTTGLWDNLWLPLLLSDGWGFGLSDGSTVGVTNLLSRLRQFGERGLRSPRIMTGLNHVAVESTLDVAETRRRMEQHGSFVGVVRDSAEISTALETGRLPVDAPELAMVLDTVLHRVTGLASLDPERPDSGRPVRRSRRGGVFASLFGRGRK